MPTKGYRQTPEHVAKRARPAAVFTCPFCGTSKEMPPSRVKMNRTCGGAECRARYLSEVGHKNRGRIKTAEEMAKMSAAQRGRAHTSEHVAKRTETRLANGWFIDPEATYARMSTAKLGRPQPGLQGANNGMWRGGVSVLADSTRQTSEYATWRLAVLNRDGWVCQVCGTDRNVIAHHILSWHLYKRYRTDVDNGIALCRACHARAHGFAQHFHQHQSVITEKP